MVVAATRIAARLMGVMEMGRTHDHEVTGRESGSHGSAMLDGALGIFFRLAASGLVPASWFRAVDPADIDKARRTGQLKLEIVSHCWRYAHYLTYQLSSLVNHRTDQLEVTMTVVSRG